MSSTHLQEPRHGESLLSLKTPRWTVRIIVWTAIPMAVLWVLPWAGLPEMILPQFGEPHRLKAWNAIMTCVLSAGASAVFLYPALLFAGWATSASVPANRRLCAVGAATLVVLWLMGVLSVIRA